MYYNRFRYYDPNGGAYISQDPIGLKGGNPNIYGYVGDTNTWVDFFGLAKSKNYDSDNFKSVPAKTEVFYRSMYPRNFIEFVRTGRIPATSETFISPSRKYVKKYDGILVRFELAEGTTEQLKQIGVRAHGQKSLKAFPDLPQVKKKWSKSKALFKPEDDVLNIGLGKGKALDIFNDNIKGFEILRVKNPKWI